MRRGIAAALALLAAACGDRDEADAPDDPPPPPFSLVPIAFAELGGWTDDAVEAALAPFVRSCAASLPRGDEAPFNTVERLGHEDYATLSGTVGDWREACERASELAMSEADPDAVRRFWEADFVPVEVTAEASLFTGYFEPSYPARRAPEAPYSSPVLTRPEGLVTVDLGAFRDDLSGRDIVGRVENGRLVPFEEAGEIDAAPPGDADTLAYLDPNDLLFLQIQGSGRLVLPDGEVLRAGYAAKNGHPYVAVGRTLVQEGHLTLEDVTMQTIRAWLAGADPRDAARVRHSNPSYVFFRELTLDDPALGPLGAQGVQLTPGRSLAVDRRYHAMGAPMFLATEATDDNPALARLMIAQDTGGAIRGPVRGDVFYGSDDEAAALAGTMNAQGRLVVLLPRALASRLLADASA